jgi:lipopolysaccharide/colanic/teichoic acid biosynthesis glycosyltransferase
VNFSPTYIAELHETLPAMTLVACLLYGIIAFNAGAYSLMWVRSVSVEAGPAVRSLALTYGALFLISYFFRLERDFSRLLLLAAMLLSLFLVITFRLFVGTLVDGRLRGRLVRQLLLCDRCDFPVPAHFERINVTELGLRPDLKDPAMLHLLAQTINGADRVTVACRPEDRRNWAMMLKGSNVRGEIIMNEIDIYGPLAIGRVDTASALTVSVGMLPLRKAIGKRAFDLACCVPGLIALAPALAITALAVKLDSRGPVLFRQRRVGRGNEFFHILKFRSMRVEQTDSDGAVSASRDDSRITRVGYFIRRTSIDELPQLFNVLMGQMSIVGPRPHALGSLAGEQLFWDVDERYWHRHVLKPGITGLAQVRGYRGATVHTHDLTNRLQADLEYIANWSFWRDMVIVLMTLKVIIHRNTY